MSNHQLHLETEFFTNGNQPDLSYLGLNHDQHHPQTTAYDSHHIHVSNSPQDPDAPSSSNRFYQEFRKIYSVSYNLKAQKDRLIEVVDDLNERIKNIESKLSTIQPKAKEAKPAEIKYDPHSEQSKYKRPRRTAQQIEKKFKCQVPFCERFYGSEGSLQQHIKLKHPQLWQRQSSEEYRPGPRDKFDMSSN